MSKREQPEIEKIAGKFLKELSHLVRDLRKFFFTIPKKKMDKIIYLIESTSWLLLGISLVLRWGRF